MKYCEFDGCRNQIESGKYCKDHSFSSKQKRKKKQQKSVYHHENKAFYRTASWMAVAAFVYEREGGCCQRCGKFVFGRQAHRHHVIPIKINPNLKLDPNNIRLLCPKCHVIEENEENKDPVFPSYFEI